MTEYPMPTSGPSTNAHHPSATRRRALRWLVPAGAAGVVALLASGVLSADANPNLAPQTAAQLLASVSNINPPSFSGTVVEKASLGLPELPNLGQSSTSGGLVSMLSGSHTARVWYGGQTKQRIALLDSLGEQDVFRNGTELWQWDSNTRTATHTTLPADSASGKPSTHAATTLTPDQAAQQALTMIDPTTTVSTDRAAVVAGRSAYTLVLAPKDTRSTVGSVRISIDGATHIPLGVQVYPSGSGKAALDISYTRIDFKAPRPENFSFTPPAGATVKQSSGTLPGTPGGEPGSVNPGAGKPGLVKPDTGLPSAGQPAETQNVTQIGTGWTTVFKVTGVPSLSSIGQQSKDAGALLGSLPQVTGNFGSGRLFRSTLISALFTSDGRAYIGAVNPDVLYAAAGHK
jgi:outer membrane lipoprotein-sorting protein